MGFRGGKTKPSKDNIDEIDEEGDEEENFEEKDAKGKKQFKLKPIHIIAVLIIAGVLFYEPEETVKKPEPGTSKKALVKPKPVAEPEPEPCLLYTSPSPRDGLLSRMPSSA